MTAKPKRKPKKPPPPTITDCAICAVPSKNGCALGLVAGEQQCPYTPPMAAGFMDYKEELG